MIRGSAALIRDWTPYRLEEILGNTCEGKVDNINTDFLFNNIFLMKMLHFIYCSYLNIIRFIFLCSFLKMAFRRRIHHMILISFEIKNGI